MLGIHYYSVSGGKGSYMTKPIFVNVMEEIVIGLVKFVLHGPAYQTFCHCNQCEKDIIATVLNRLPSYYVTTNKARDEAFQKINTSTQIEEINKEIISAIYKVGKKPNHPVEDV